MEHTTDSHTRLRPGDEGTVRRYDPRTRVLDVTWDSGSRLSMLLDEGDRVRRVPTRGDAGWGRVLDALRAAGAAAGRDAASWWAQHVLGARACGDVAAAARQVLAGVDGVDAPVLDGLPTADRYVLADDRGRYAAHAPLGAPRWEELTARQCDQSRWAWCDGYDEAAVAEVARQCRMILHPDGDDRDLSHVYPDRVRPGGPGVFAGDWAWTPNPSGELRVSVGFVGVLVGVWDGWAVFTCTREVAEAIVADQVDARDRLRQRLAADGIAGDRLDQVVDATMARLWFDGDVLVADFTRVYDDSDAVDRIAIDAYGRYVVPGRAWAWTAVDPYDCIASSGTFPTRQARPQPRPRSRIAPIGCSD